MARSPLVPESLRDLETGKGARVGIPGRGRTLFVVVVVDVGDRDRRPHFRQWAFAVRLWILSLPMAGNQQLARATRAGLELVFEGDSRWRKAP
jgi:hypothetical protein